MLRALLFFALPALWLLTACWQGTSRETVATVLSSHGEVAYSQGSTIFRAVDSDAKFGGGSIVRTSENGQLDLSLVPGALLRILHNSELKIQRLSIAKDGNETGDSIRERVARLSLKQGAIVVMFEGAANFTVETPQVAVNVLPSCLFRLDANTHRTRLTCVRGNLSATERGNERVMIEPGYFREWPSQKGAAPTTDDGRAEEDRIAALSAASELQELYTARRNQLPQK